MIRSLIKRRPLTIQHQRKLPTATVFENRMKIYTPRNERPLLNNMYEDEYGIKSFIMEHTDRYLGTVKVNGVELTQMHRDVVETILSQFEYKGEYIEGKSLSYKFTRYSLLKVLNRTDSMANYQWLENILNDLKNVSLDVVVKDFANKDKQQRARVVLQGTFNILSGLWTEKVKEPYPERTFEVTFSHDYLHLFHFGMSVWYHHHVAGICQQPYGFIKDMIRYCLTSSFRGEKKLRMKFEDLLEKIGITAESKGQDYISKLKGLLKPVIDAKTGESQPSDITKVLLDKFCIEVYWEGRQCEISYDKADMDKAFPNTVFVKHLNKDESVPAQVKCRDLTRKKAVVNEEVKKSDLLPLVDKLLKDCTREDALKLAQAGLLTSSELGDRAVHILNGLLRGR